jgi:hypothetical protein
MFIRTSNFLSLISPNTKEFYLFHSINPHWLRLFVRFDFDRFYPQYLIDGRVQNDSFPLLYSSHNEEGIHAIDQQFNDNTLRDE